MFIDSSVFVAILSDEQDADELLDAIEASTTTRVTSALVVLESTMRLTTKQKAEPSAVLEDLQKLLKESGIEVMPIHADHGPLAVQAFSAFGKGRGHPAQLNLADCLSYACARSRGVPLLYKGRDFSHTDLA